MEEFEIGGKKYSGYFLPGLIFKKCWFWFYDPVDVEKTDMVNFFSYNDLAPPGFKRKSRLTTLIDLSQDLQAIQQKMRQDFIAKQIRKGERNGIVINQDNNFKDFRLVYEAFRKNKNIHNDKYEVFEKNGLGFFAYYRTKLIAGGIFIATNQCIRAWVLASLRLEDCDGKIREIIGQANRMVIWEAIKYAKNNGYKIFDLGGINPDSSEKADVSLAQFKEAFGGERKMTFYYYKVYSRLLRLWMKIRGIK